MGRIPVVLIALGVLLSEKLQASEKFIILGTGLWAIEFLASQMKLGPARYETDDENT